MKILLLGGTGTLSTDVLRLAINKGYDVSILNRGNHNNDVPICVKRLIADFKQVDSIIQAICNENYDVVVDFLSRKKDDIERVFPVFASRCHQYIFVSSSCVYERHSDELITESAHKPNLDWSYNIEKYQCEQRLLELCKEGTAKCKYTIIRPYITYNEKRIPFGLMPDYGKHWTLIGRLKANKPFFVWNDGDNYCTLTHTKDFAVGMVGLFMNTKAFNEDFHITTNEYHTWNDVLEILKMTLHSTSDMVKIPLDAIIKEFPEYNGMLKGDRALHARFDIRKLKNAVPEYNPQISLKKGIEDVIQSYQAHNYYDGIDYIWDAKVDRLIANNSKYTPRYVAYIEDNTKQHFQYLVYRYLRKDVVLRALRKLIRMIRV